MSIVSVARVDTALQSQMGPIRKISKPLKQPHVLWGS